MNERFDALRNRIVRSIRVNENGRLRLRLSIRNRSAMSTIMQGDNFSANRSSQHANAGP